MHHELWSGIDLKIEHAEFFLEQMTKALLPPERTSFNVANHSSGMIQSTNWQRSFYAYLDAFLAMARSIPEIITVCFGADRVMQKWLSTLSPAETERRERFSTQFQNARNRFKKLALSNARNISLHRSGVAPVEVGITGRHGVTHIGTPVQRVPDAESKRTNGGENPALQWAAAQPPVLLQPVWTDFKTDGKQLFPECRAYLDEARMLRTTARAIVDAVHRTDKLTPPPASLP